MTKGICQLCADDVRKEVVRIGNFVVCLKHDKQLDERFAKRKNKEVQQPKEKLSTDEKTKKERKKEKHENRRMTRLVKKANNHTTIYVVGSVKDVISKAGKNRKKAERMIKRQENNKSRIDKLNQKIEKCEAKITKQKAKQIVFLTRCSDADFLEQSKVQKLKIETLGKTADGGLRFYKNKKWFIVPLSLLGKNDSTETLKAEDKKLVEIGGTIKEKTLGRKLAKELVKTE